MDENRGGPTLAGCHARASSSQLPVQSGASDVESDCSGGERAPRRIREGERQHRQCLVGNRHAAILRIKIFRLQAEVVDDRILNSVATVLAITAGYSFA